MNFYNLGDNTILQARSYLFERPISMQLLPLKRILVVEDDSRIQKLLQKIILEEHPQATCDFTNHVGNVLELQQEKNFDLVIASYYESEDEVDYDFWDEVREEYPHLEVIVLSHVNDREYYEMLEKFGSPEDHTLYPVRARLKNFFETVFGGRHG